SARTPPAKREGSRTHLRSPSLPPGGHMSEPGWKELLGELRRLSADTARSQEEMWSAIDEIRELLRSQIEVDGNAPDAHGGRSRARAQRSKYRRLRRELRSFLAEALPANSHVAIV